jgi:hypothetical protein
VLKASAVVLVVVALENFVLGPRIVGKMMELHPVVLIALLPVAQYFFGVWGLILATPVMVYVIHVLILQHGLPGKEAAQRSAAPGVALAPTDGPPQEGGTGALSAELREEKPQVIEARVSLDQARTSNVAAQPGEACEPTAR